MSFDFSNKAAQIRAYAENGFPQVAGKIALRFIDDNFRRQSWEGVPWKRRKPSAKRNRGRAILVDTAKLRRGNRFRKASGTAIVFNDIPYAKAHNEGFRGNVRIPAHQRRLFGRFKVSSVKTRRTSLRRTEKGITNVKAHARYMRLPRRQFAPTGKRPSAKLTSEIQRSVRLALLKILKS